MTKVTFLKCGIAVACLAAAGCATPMYGTVLPQSDGTYMLVEKGKTERAAMKMAQSDAEKTCKKRAKTKEFVTLDHSSEFVGVTVDKGEGTFSGIAASVVEVAARHHSNENYKVKMTFKCS